MAKTQKKFITLKEASKLSGYTGAELRSFAKIGLVASMKRKNVLYIKADAFKKINAPVSKTNRSTISTQVSAPKKLTLMQMPNRNLIPFTQPNKALIKVLEPVAFAAAIVMLLYVTTIPGVSEGILGSVAMAENTVAFMGQSVEDLITVSVNLPTEAANSALAFVPSISPNSVDAAGQLGQVAGISTVSNVEQIDSAISSPTLTDQLTNILISIADASDAFQNSLNELNNRSFEYVVTNLSFEKLDPIIQSTFKW